MRLEPIRNDLFYEHMSGKKLPALAALEVIVHPILSGCKCTNRGPHFQNLVPSPRSIVDLFQRNLIYEPVYRILKSNSITVVSSVFSDIFGFELWPLEFSI